MVRAVKQLGLTGSIGSGKSTVADQLAARGAVIIDADQLAREATRDPEVVTRIAQELGEDLVTDGELDRAKTAERVFGDEAAREILNAIIHPVVRARSERRVAELRGRADPPPLVVHDIPLLFESGLQDRFDAVAVVVAPLEIRVERVLERSGLSHDDVLARDAAQMPQEEKARRATYVIDNGGPLEALEAQIERVWRELTGATS